MNSRLLKYAAVSTGLLLALSSFLSSGVNAQRAPRARRSSTPTTSPTTTTSSSSIASSNTTPGALSFTQAQYEAAIAFDISGENGKLASNPNGPSLGYPCGVPNSYGWKWGGSGDGTTNVANAVAGRGQQLAGAGYNQVYNACPGPNTRKSMANARIEFTDMIVDYYSISLNKWVRAVKQP
ncbi:MAG: hypothetical protein WCA07_03150, partial [Gloeobacterales cyanobacterium]